jgi:ribosomal protein L14E/L6E/L27E
MTAKRTESDMQRSIKQGDFVVSLAGRDRGRTFIVTGICGDGYVLIADGKLRKVEKPKRKKLKHLSPAGGSCPDTDKLTNRKAKAEIRRFRESTETVS